MDRSLPLPREHGAYVVLLSSWIVGLLYAAPGEWWRPLASLALLLLLFAVPEVFKALRREKKRAKRSRRVIVYSSTIAMLTVAMSTICLLAAPDLWVLAPIGLAFTALVIWANARRLSMSTISMFAFAALALAAPATMILNGSSDRELLALSWLLCAGFFCGSNVNVALRLTGVRNVQSTGFYHAGILLAWCAVAGGFPGFFAGLAALLMNLLRFFWIVRHAHSFRTTTLKRIGLQEALLSGAFLALNSLPIA